MILASIQHKDLIDELLNKGRVVHNTAILNYECTWEYRFMLKSMVERLSYVKPVDVVLPLWAYYKIPERDVTLLNVGYECCKEGFANYRRLVVELDEEPFENKKVLLSDHLLWSTNLGTDRFDSSCFNPEAEGGWWDRIQACVYEFDLSYMKILEVSN